MGFDSKINMTSAELPLGSLGIDLNSNILFRVPATIGIASLIATVISFLAYLSYSPRVDKKSPAFTSDKVLFLGSWGFFTRKWSFWKNSVEESKTGNFSFWLGKNHVVAVSGEAARKMYLDSRELDFVHGSVPLQGMGPDHCLPAHKIFEFTFHNGRSYFQRRIIDLQKTDQLVKRLPNVNRDARSSFEALAKIPSGVTNPFNSFYPIALAQGCRIFCTDEISDTPKMLEGCLNHLLMFQSTSSRHCIAVPWLPSMSYMKRRYGRYGLKSIVAPVVSKRMKKDAPRVDDALQTLIDYGDSEDYITNFFITILFLVVVNPGILAGGLMNMIAHHADWQERIYGEIKAAAQAHSKNKDAPLVEQLESIPLEAWESALPSIELCFHEVIRLKAAFPMFRRNISPNAIPIPGTDEVIPPGSFASYNTTDAHYNEELYPNPTKFDPERYSEGREEFKKQTYSFVGWGHGRHPCLGMRWAKVQQNIIISYAIVMFKWKGCDANGQPLPPGGHKTDLDSVAPGLPQGVYCKYVRREKT